MKPAKTLLIASAWLVACAAEIEPPSNEASPTASSSDIAAALEEQRAMVSAAKTTEATGTAYDFEFAGLVLDRISLSAFAGKPILVVNTASKCGFTPQYEGLQEIYERFKDQGLIVLGIPSGDFGGQELDTSAEIEEFCRLNFGVSFPMTQKYSVSGRDAHAFYRWAEDALGNSAVPKWNFHKILIDKNGIPTAAFPSTVAPKSPQITAAIERVIQQ